MSERASVFPIWPILTAYYATVALWVVGALYPQSRLWAFNWWAYYDRSMQVVALLLFLLLPAIASYTTRHAWTGGNTVAPRESRKSWWVYAGSFVLVMMALFVLLRTQTHFLGDGYTLLANLSEGQPVLKIRNLGEAAIHWWLSGMLPGDPESAALLSYRIVSIGAGALFLATIVWFSGRLFQLNRQRLLFLVGMSSGGFMLLYFGYVEHYALFVWSVITICLTGLAILERKLHRLWVLLPFVLSCFFHAAGIVLLPAVVYVLFQGTSFARRISRHSRKTRLAWLISGVVVASSVGMYLYLTKPAFRLMVVPIWTDRFTIGGYTIFSGSHLIDLANLLFLIVPGALVGVVCVSHLKREMAPFRRANEFLATATICALIAAFAFDPKLGMARDWDLLSFGIAPLFVMLVHGLVTTLPRSGQVPLVLTLVVALNFGVLLPRAIAVSSPQIAMRHIESYLALDVVRSRTTMGILFDYYSDLNRTDKVREVEAAWKERYPETAIVDSGMALYAQGQAKPAIDMFHKALEHDPCNFSAYADAGMAFLALQKYDSALTYLEIAKAMNSYNAAMLNNLANAYYFKGRIRDAQETWEKTLDLDSTVLAAKFSLSQIYAKRGRMAESRRLFIEAAKAEGAPGYYVTQLADMMTARGNYAEAAAAYHRALAAGLDSMYVWNVISKYPALRKSMGW